MASSGAHDRRKQTGRRAPRRAGSSTAGHAAGNVRATLDTFVGRRGEMAQVRRLLDDARLVTLTGPPGVGKTRLALEVATEAADSYADGVWLVELASITDADLVGRAIASVLSVPHGPDSDVTDVLVAHLAERNLLVVLDNCEHLVEPCARLAEAVLQGCPVLSVLATSQEPLSFAGEQCWPVAPLSLPGDDDAALAEALARSEAVQLFVERAKAVRPGFSLGDRGDVAAVVEICRRLDGIPLAIELAAARVAMLSPVEIAARLGQRFELLTSGSRTVPARHQTLLGAVAWSYELLSGPEQTLLRRLSVFAGGATLAGAEHVCAGDGVEAASVCELVGRLVARSLVSADTTGADSRYRLAETIRAYADDRLGDAGESPAVRDRHLAWCVELAEQAEGGLTGADQGAWLRRLELEQDNVRAALDWAADQGHTGLELRLAGAFTMFWRMRGSFREGRRRLERALGQAGDTDDPVLAKALWGAGFMAHMMNDGAPGTAYLERSLALYRVAEDPQGCSRCLMLLANASVFSNPGDTLALLHDTVELAGRAGDSWCLGHALALAGMAHSLEGDPVKARQKLEEAIAVARSHSDDQSLRLALLVLVSVEFGQGNYSSAGPLLHEGLELAHRLGEGYTVAAALIQGGRLDTVGGHYDEAEQRLEEALAAARRVGAPAMVAGALSALGKLAHARGGLAAARLLHEEAVSMAHFLSGINPELPVQGLAEVYAALGDLDSAARLFQEAADHAREIGNGPMLASALHGLGVVAGSAGERDRALALVHEALILHEGAGHLLGVVDCLETLSAYAGEAGEPVRSARLLGAAASLREHMGYARTAVRRETHDTLVARGETELGEEEWEAAWTQGACLSPREGVEYAGRNRGRRDRTSKGWGSLTPAERAVVALVAEGLNNAEIGARLLVSPRTVERHLTNVFAKLGLASRTELAVEALGHGEADPRGEL